MPPILHLLREPLFWLASICFSVILNIVGNLLTPSASGLIQRLYKQRSAQSRAKRLKLLGQIIVIFDKPDAIVQAKLDVLYAFGFATILLLVAIAFLVASLVLQAAVNTGIGLLFAVLAVPLIWLSLYIANHGINSIGIVRFAEQRKSAASDFAHQRGLDLQSPEVFSFSNDWDRQTFGCTIYDVKEDIESRRASKPKTTDEDHSSAG